MQSQVPGDGVKKPYERPQLVVYGDIRQVTKAIDMTGTPDGGHGMANRT